MSDGWDKLFRIVEALREMPDEAIVMTVLGQDDRQTIVMTLGELRQVFREGWPE